jgi:nitrate reductase NapE component
MTRRQRSVVQTFTIGAFVVFPPLGVALVVTVRYVK